MRHFHKCKWILKKKKQNSFQIGFWATSGLLSSSVIHSGLPDLRRAGWNPRVESVDFLGLEASKIVRGVTVNNRTVGGFEQEGGSSHRGGGGGGRLRVWGLGVDVDQPFYVNYF